MKHKTTFLLMVIVVVMGAFIWIMEKKTVSSGKKSDEENCFFDIEPERINYISFYRDGNFIECVNERDQWLVNKPVRDRADNGAIHKLLGIMRTLPKKEIITLAEREARELTLDDYGLAQPRAWIVLGAGAVRRKLMIGADSPLRDAVYVRLDNENEIIATAIDALYYIPERVDDIRDRRLFRGSPTYVTRLEIKQHDKPMLQLILEGSEWVIYKPVIARADWIKISSLLNSVFSIRILQFMSETMSDPIAYGVGADDAILKISLWQGQEQENETVLFGKAADAKGETIFANRQGTAPVYAVDRHHIESLYVTTADIRDSRLYFMASNKIRFVGVSEGDSVLQLCRANGDEWKIIRPHQWPADGKIVADLVSRLNALRITALVDEPVTNLQSFGLDAPARVIRVADYVPESERPAQGGEQTALSTVRRERILKLSGSKPGQEHVFAQFDDNPQIYQISAASAMTISVDPLKYRDGIVLQLQPETIRSITLKKEGLEQSVERDAFGVWKPMNGAVGEADAEVINAVLAEVAELGVSRFEGSGKKNLAVYGLQPASVSLTFALTGEGGISKSLFIGSDSEDLGVYAMLQGQDVVFVIEKEKADLLGRRLIR